MSNKPETQSTTSTSFPTAAPAAPKADSAANPFASFASFDPMTSWNTAQQAFHKMMAESFGRAQAFVDEYVALETQLTSRAQGAIDSWAQLAHDALTYSTQLSAQARKLGVEAARKMGAAA